MNYRPEIDGLRAVAVIPVILFHAGFSIFSGGFVGVDIFFVISGYLITGIILNELSEDRFSILRFYERRVRRILPALFFVMICCIPFAWMWMLPPQFKDFSQSLIAVSLFVSNILFCQETGYFAAAAEEKPLLHTWSLAVEEQYYMLFPLFLIVVWRFGRNPAFYSILVIAALSLLISEWGWRNKPDANFYLAPSRIWELLAGSTCAFLQHKGTQKSNNPLALFGLALILFSILYFDDKTPFPSLYALAPVGGTALIIMFADRGTWAARLLSTKPFVGIGLISYSAYLWHQPLFAFARIRSIVAPDPSVMLLLAFAALVLATLSWRFVEQPFRTRSTPPRPLRNTIFATAGIVGAALVAFGLYGHTGNGLQNRFAPGILTAAAEGATNADYTRCEYNIPGGYDVPPLPDAACVFPTTAATGKTAIIIGDSHASAIAHPITTALNQTGYTVTEATVSGCAPFPGFRYAGYDCNTANQTILDHLMAEQFDVVIVAFRPHTIFNPSPFDNTEGGIESDDFPYVIYDEAALSVNPKADDFTKATATVQQGMQSLFTLNSSVILVYPIPEAGWNVPQLMAKVRMFTDAESDQSLSTDQTVFNTRNSAIIAAFDALDDQNLYRIKPHEILCDTLIENRCVNAIGGDVFYRDDDHLSEKGAKFLLPQILQQVQQIENAAGAESR